MLLSAVDAQPNLRPRSSTSSNASPTPSSAARWPGSRKRLEAAGAKRGERVILLMANSIEMDVALMAVMATCAQVAPINPFLTPSELKKQLGDCPGVRDRQRQAVRGEGSGRRGAVRHSDAAHARAGRHDARRVEVRRVARARSLAAAEARRFRAADFHGRLDGRAEGRQPHASWAALLGVAARDRVAVQVRRGAVPQRRADVPHLGARLFDVGADLYAQHARHGAALRRRQSRARALRSQDHGVRRRPRADLHGLARRARCSRRPISRSCVIARPAARRAPRSCIANGSRRPASRSSKVGA